MTGTAAAFARAAGRLYAAFGEPATYAARDAAGVEVVVGVERDLSRYGEVAAVNAHTAVVSVRTSDVAAMPRRGDTFTLAGSGEVLTVDSVQSSDALEHRCFCA